MTGVDNQVTPWRDLRLLPGKGDEEGDEEGDEGRGKMVMREISEKRIPEKMIEMRLFYTDIQNTKYTNIGWLGDWRSLANLNGSFIPDENGGSCWCNPLSRCNNAAVPAQQDKRGVFGEQCKEMQNTEIQNTEQQNTTQQERLRQ